MLKITILGIVLAAVALSGAVSVASAETVPSPLQQVRDGVPIGEVVCSENRVLMVSQTGMPACVFEESVLELETRGFEFIGEPFDMFPIKSSDMFPIKSSDMADSTLWTGDPPPVITISRLPNIGETAIVEINFTNAVWGDVTDTERYRNGFFETGWRVDSEFEIVDSGGLKYETRYFYGTNEISNYRYTEFTPLNAGESKTYRIEVRAVEEGKSAVSAYGYGEEVAIFMYLDDEETMHLQDHMALYPEMHERTARTVSDKDQPPKPLTDEESRALEQNVQEPTHEELIEFITIYVRDEQLSIEWALDNLLLPFGPLNMTEVRQILTDTGYTNDEIDDTVSQHQFTRPLTRDTSVDGPEFAVTGADDPYWLSSDFAPLYMQDGAGSSAKKYVSLYAGPDPLANITKGEIMPFWSRDDSFPYVQVKIPKSTPMADTMTVSVNYDFTPRHGAEFNPDNIVQDAAFGAFTDEKVPYMGAVFLIQHPPQIKMISDYPTIPYDNDEYDCSGISWIILPYNGNVPHQADISFVATAPIPRMEDVFRISPEYSGVIDRSQWYISTDEDAIVVTPFPRSSADFDVQSESGINMHFDKNYYTWTDRVYITITALEYNLDSGTVDSIGGNNTGTGIITVSTGAAGIEGYELIETGEDTGVFVGHVTLTGFQFEGMYHEHKHQINPRTGGTGPTGGLVATSAMPDQITVSFLSLGGENVTKSVPIRWNAGTVQWFDIYREGKYPLYGGTLFFIRLTDPDMNWNPDSADTFSVDVFSDTNIQSAKLYETETGNSRIWRGDDRYVTETGNSTGIFEGVVFTTDTGGSPQLRLTSTEETLYTMYRDSTISHDMCNSVYLEHAFTINKRAPVGDFTYPLFSPPDLPVDLYFR